MKLANKTAVITGASTGIGRAIAVKLASEGAKTMLLARSKDGLQKTLDEITKHGGKGKIFCVDLESTENIKKVCTEIKESEGETDILVNVAGIWHSEDKAFSGIDYTDFSTDEILSTYKVGLTAPSLLAHELIPSMKANSKIVNISGTFEDGANGWLPYYVSKKGIEHLTIGLADELRNKRIQVNCVSPSDCATEAYKKFFPEYANPENAILPEDVASLTLFLCSEDANLITGQVIVIKQQAAED
jgi:3-oxoacyl-[acyl-carrier protein] reductase